MFQIPYEEFPEGLLVRINNFGLGQYYCYVLRCVLSYDTNTSKTVLGPNANGNNNTPSTVVLHTCLQLCGPDSFSTHAFCASHLCGTSNAIKVNGHRSIQVGAFSTGHMNCMVTWLVTWLPGTRYQVTQNPYQIRYLGTSS